MRIKFCPRCRSKKFEVVKQGKLPGMPYHYGAPNYYRCLKCGFTSFIFPEKNKKHGENNSLNDYRHYSLSRLTLRISNHHLNVCLQERLKAVASINIKPHSYWWLASCDRYLFLYDLYSNLPSYCLREFL